MVSIDDIMKKLKVGALEDLTLTELEVLISYIDNLEEIRNRYENVMDSLPIEYEDMFPEEYGN